MNFNYSKDEIVNWDVYYNDLTKNSSNSSIDERFTEFGEWSACKDECGFQNQGRSRFLLPALYGGKSIENINRDDMESLLFETKPCYKFCRSEEDVLRKWREYTGCPAVSLPEITKNKFMKDVDEEGNEVEFESSVFIDNLRYYSDAQLNTVFGIWKPVVNPDVSRDCYGNELGQSVILHIGSRIYSKNAVSYLEYGADGSLSFFSLKVVGEDTSYNKVTELRPAPNDPLKKGSYLKIVIDKIIVFTNDNLKLYEANLSGGRGIECKLVVGETGLLVVERNNNVVNVVGGIQSEYYVKDTEFVFNPKLSGEYSILQNESKSAYLSVSNTEVKLVNGGKVIHLLASSTNGCSVVLNKNGLKVLDNSGTKLFELLVSNCAIISLYGNNVEFYSMSGDKSELECLCGYIGTNMSLLTEEYKIKKPNSADEEKSCKLECIAEGVVKSQLVYQSDGDLVFKVNGSVAWSSNTKSKPSTHMFISRGELFIMNNSSIVFRSNSKLSDGYTYSFLLLTEMFLLILTQKEEDLELVRIYPNTIKLNGPGWNSIKSIGSFYLESNYEKYPAFSVRSKNNINKGLGITSSLVDMSSYINVNPSSTCNPLDVFCDSTKIEKTNSSGINAYSVELDVNNNKWKTNVKNVSFTNPSIILSFDYNTGSSYLYSSKRILGYDLLVEEDNLGDYSTPIVFLKTNSGTSEVRIIMKKPIDEFVVDVMDDISAGEFMNNLSKEIIFDSVIASMFGVKIHPTFKFESSSSSFSDRDIANQIMNTRVDMLETACKNKNMLSENCQSAFNKLKFYSERAKKYYDLTMELECRKDFTNSNCSSYIPSSSGVIKFINNYCGKLKNTFTVDCSNICNSNMSHLFERCVDRNNIYIFVLIVVLVVVLSVRRVRRMFSFKFLKTNTNNTEAINTSTK